MKIFLESHQSDKLILEAKINDADTFILYITRDIVQLLALLSSKPK